MEKPQDEKRLWEIAQKHVAFRRHLIVYVLVNIALIVIWYLSWDKEAPRTALTFWFLYALCGWGIGVVFHYWSAYHDDDRSVEKEYQKLKAMQNAAGTDKTAETAIPDSTSNTNPPA